LSWFSTESPMWPQETSQFLANHDGGIMTTTVLVSTHCVTLNKSPLSLDLSCFLVKLDCLRLTVVPWMASRFHEAGMARVTLLYSTLITAHNSLGLLESHHPGTTASQLWSPEFKHLYHTHKKKKVEGTSGIT
jgi:hypothetical protein